MDIVDIVKCRRTSGDIGLEIEVEANNLPHSDTVQDYWRVERDASLRGSSCEFVLREPQSVTGLDKALKSLSKSMKDAGTVERPTYRAGIHVHINVQDLTAKQLVTFVSAYFMLEEVLLKFCNETRRGNHFCLRMSDASYTLDLLSDAIRAADLTALNNEDIRYAGLNLTSLFKYGSIEFRSLESTFDFEKIKVWAGTLHRLKEFAKTVDSPTDLLGEASLRGFVEYAPIILGAYTRHYSAWITHEAIQNGVRNIQFAIYSREWDKPDLNIFKKGNIFTGA